MSTRKPRSFNTAARPRKAPTPPRIRRRRWLVWLSVVPAIVLFVHGVSVATLNSRFAEGAQEYAAEQWWAAYKVFRGMRTTNVVDPWKAHFNTGTAAYREGMLFSAERSLQEALPLAPEEHRCDVLTNLAIVYAAQAVELEAEADAEYERALAQRAEEIKRMLGEPYDASVFELDYQGDEITSGDRFRRATFDKRVAADYYALAAAAVDDPSCDNPPSPDASPEEHEQAEQEREQREADREQLEEQSREAEEQRQEMERVASGEEAEQPEDTGETPEERAAREEAERQEKVKERNEQAKEDAGGDGEGGGDAETGDGDGGAAPPVSNW